MERRYGDYLGDGEAHVPPPPDPIRDAVAAGAVVLEFNELGETVRFLDRVDVPRISGGSDPLDLAYANVRRWHVTDETNQLGVVVDDSGEVVSTTVGSSPGNRQESFEMAVYVYGGGVRQWAADRLRITRWRRLSPTVEVSA